MLEHFPLDVTKCIIDFANSCTTTIQLMQTSKRMCEIVQHPKLHQSLLTLFSGRLINMFFKNSLETHRKQRRKMTVSRIIQSRNPKTELFPYDTRKFFNFTVEKTNTFISQGLYPDKLRLIFAMALASQNMVIVNDLLSHPYLQQSATSFNRFYKQCKKGRLESVRALLRLYALKPHRKKCRILKTMINLKTNLRRQCIVQLLLDDLLKRKETKVHTKKFAELLFELISMCIGCQLSQCAYKLLCLKQVKTNPHLDINKLYLKALTKGVDSIGIMLYDDPRLDKTLIAPILARMRVV